MSGWGMGWVKIRYVMIPTWPGMCCDMIFKCLLPYTLVTLLYHHFIMKCYQYFSKITLQVYLMYESCIYTWIGMKLLRWGRCDNGR